ncbi:MAG: hypothetical protein HYZ13_03835 [Acidobacteria bacterium]|nr:hypothetical protein [Acidobacteriota bacterium]
MDLLPNLFSLSVDEPVSVYEVRSDHSEAIALSALAVGGVGSASNLYGIRLAWEDLKRLGIRYEKTEGTTGLKELDQHHLDIFGGREKFEPLIEIVLKRQTRGMDGIRVLQERQVKSQWTMMETMTDGITIEMRKKLQDKISKISSKGPDDIQSLRDYWEIQRAAPR